MLIFGGALIGICAGTYAPNHNLSYDVVGSKYINIATTTSELGFAVMEIFIGVFMYIQHSWRIQIYAIIVWNILCILLVLFLISEGPRYHIIKNKHQQAIKTFHKIARFNNKKNVFPRNIKLNIEGTNTTGANRKQLKFWHIFQFKSELNFSSFVLNFS